MLAIAAKAGIGVFVSFLILGVLQSQSIGDVTVAFIAAGILPGTDLQLPPDLTLIAVAGVLMVVAAYLCKMYLAERARMELAAQEFENLAEDPEFEMLIPGLRRVMRARRTAEAAASDLSLSLYFWFRSLGRPVTAQAIAVRKGISASLVRFDAWATSKADMQVLLDKLSVFIKAAIFQAFKTYELVSAKARYYFLRFISS